MTYFSNTYRSTETEILDDFTLHGPEMEAMLTDLERVNKWLGGDAITIAGITELLKDIPKETEIVIVDIGCGDGALLRKVARFGEKHGYRFNCIGIDANVHIIEQAKERSSKFATISFSEGDIFSEKSLPNHFHIALCTLFLHHFESEQVATILQQLAGKAKVGVVVNDLVRSRMAFWLFKGFSSIFIKTRIAKHDGLVSVARGFKKGELQVISEAIKSSTYTIRWKWAFRWQLILKSNSKE